MVTQVNFTAGKRSQWSWHCLTQGVPPRCAGSSETSRPSSVPGTFAYAPAAGEVLDAGSQTLQVAFFPTDSVHYSTACRRAVLRVGFPSLTPAVRSSDP